MNIYIYDHFAQIKCPKNLQKSKVIWLKSSAVHFYAFPHLV